MNDKPTFAQLRHPDLQVDVSDVAQATTAWQVHRLSFAHMLRVVAEDQYRRWPNRITPFPPEIHDGRQDQAAAGFQLLLLGDLKGCAMVPSLADYPTLAYPARRLSGGRATQILVVDGWSGGPSGLLAVISNVRVQLDGNLSNLEMEAWKVLTGLGVVLDAASRVMELRGELEQEGWTAIPGLREAADGFRPPAWPPFSKGAAKEKNNPLGGGRP